MTRWLLLLSALLSSAALTQPTKAPIPQNAMWAFWMPPGSAYWALEEELGEREPNGSISAWMHGFHRDDPTVKYRSSIWKIRFSCRGHMTMVAYSTFGPDGREIESWDGFGNLEAIRPRSMYADLEKVVCAPG